MSDLLFDAPYWLMILLGLVGIVLLLFGLMRQNKPVKTTGGVILGIGVVLLLLSIFVETGKKQVTRKTHELVAAVVAAKAPAIRALLDAKAGAYGLDREGIVQTAISASTDSMVKDVTITTLNVTEDGSGITSKFDCLAQFKPESTIPAGAVPTSWELHWVKTPDHGWLIYDIKCTRMLNQDASTVVNYILSHKGLGGS